MKIPTKFSLNTDNFKVYFDNEKKTHVCEDLETGEKTNIGVLGTFLQMGILKTIDDNTSNPDDRLSYLMDKVVSLEKKLDKLSIEPILKKPKISGEVNLKKAEIHEIQEEGLDLPKREPILKKYSKSDEEEPTINQRIIKKILEKTTEEENKEPPKDVNVESTEEIDNWMEI